jgi:hypothetical protein
VRTWNVVVAVKVSVGGWSGVKLIDDGVLREMVTVWFVCGDRPIILQGVVN